MGKGKLAKFADMAANPLVVECPFWQLQKEGFALKGNWHKEFFHNNNPITLELGCGRGEYTIGLAKQYPDCNFIGVDIKGSRMWHGAKEAMEAGMKNVAFLRTNIECIDGLFAEGEVAEIWLTFSDPQMKKATKRLTSTYFMERYRRFVVDRGLINVKTDSNFLATYTKYMAEKNGLPINQITFDLYKEEKSDSPLTSIRTYYEQMWLDRGIPIKFIQFALPHEGKLEEPNIEIPVDGYRSYNHQVVSTKTTGK
ncbi:MAG: tRNA (guanosine(46)-N7)-methyltransferase TrmB [Prevotellaceae bacterium]|nr:tRNA (guanosine(46)-N7)-methyltransferase TrmB [Candidatus Minthosoma caballi]